MENTVKNLLNRMSAKEILAVYNELNSCARGFEVGICGDTLCEACKEEDYTVFRSVDVGDQEILCVRSCEGMCVLVADVNGPWGVVYAPWAVISKEIISRDFPDYVDPICRKMQEALSDAGYRTHIVDHVHLKQETEFIMLAVFEAWVEATNALKL